MRLDFSNMCGLFICYIFFLNERLKKILLSESEKQWIIFLPAVKLQVETLLIYFHITCVWINRERDSFLIFCFLPPFSLLKVLLSQEREARWGEREKRREGMKEFIRHFYTQNFHRITWTQNPMGQEICPKWWLYYVKMGRDKNQCLQGLNKVFRNI